MLTLSEAFEKNRFKKGGKLNIIVSLVDATSTPWFFSIGPLDILYGAATITCKPILQSISGISEKIDPMTRTWKVADVTVELSNMPFVRRSTDGALLRISDVLSNPVGRAATVFMIPAAMQSIEYTDLLVRFQGFIAAGCEYDDTICSLRLVDKGAVFVKSIPTTVISEEYSGAPNENLSVPILYGTWSQAYDEYSRGAGNGLAKGIRFDRDMEPSYLFADHTIKTISMPWVEIERGLHAYPSNFVSVANGRGVEFRKTSSDTSPGFVVLNAPFYCNLECPFTQGDFPHPTDEFNLAQYWIPTTGCSSPQNVYDGDLGTVATIYDNVQDSGATPPNYSRIGLYGWGVNHSTVLWNLVDTKHAYLTRIYVETQGHAIHTMPSGPSAMPFPYLCFGGRQQGGGFTIAKLGRNYWAYDPNTKWTTWINLPSGHIASYLGEVEGQQIAADRYSWAIIWWIGAQGTSGSTGDDALLSIGEQRVRVEFPEEEFPDIGWAECEGRMFGTWIDDADRPEGYSAGDLIETPSYIIESLLRDEIGFTDDDIDVASFDKNASTALNARINITQPTSTDKVIKQLTEQSTFCYIYSGAGKARLISMTHDELEVPTIPWSHITQGGIKVSRTTRLVNQLIVNSRWIPEFNSYTDQDVYHDLESQAIHGLHKTIVNWENINGLTSEYMAKHYCGSPNYLWSRPHIIVEFATLGFMYADLEIGDKFFFDADTVDPHLLLDGETWLQHKFLVTEIQQYLDRTFIQAIQLNYGFPGMLAAPVKFSGKNPTVIAASGNPDVIIPESAAGMITECEHPTVISGIGPKLITPKGGAITICTGGSPAVINDKPLVIEPDGAWSIWALGTVRPHIPGRPDYRLPTLNGTIGHWRFEADLTDQTFEENDLTGVEIDAGDYVYGYTDEDSYTAIEVNWYGTPQEYCYISAADATDFNFGVLPFTVEVIFKMSTNEWWPPPSLIKKHTSIKLGRGWQLGIADGIATFKFGEWPDKITAVSSAPYVLNDGDWHYVAVTVDRPLWKMSLYVDGMLVNSVTTTEAAMTQLVNDDDLLVGQFNGTIDEICVTSGRALNAFEIQRRAQGQPTGESYALDFTTSTEAHAKVLFSEDLTLSEGMTIMCWVKKEWVSGEYDWEPIVIKSIGTAVPHWYLKMKSTATTNEGQLELHAAGEIYDSTATSSVISNLCNNQWHHIAATADGEYMRFYVDGSLISQHEATELPWEYSHCGDVYIGNEYQIGSPPNYYMPFSGCIDDVCLYNEPLNIAYIQDHYNAGNASCSPLGMHLMGYWRFDEGIGIMIEDVMGGHDARLGTYGNEPAFTVGKVKCRYD